MSLGFNYELYPNEVIELIRADQLDKDIKEYIYNLIDLEELKKDRDITEYFDLSCLSEEEDGYLFFGACVGEKEYTSMTDNEKKLHNEFQLRVLMLYNEVKAEINNKIIKGV